MQLRSNKIILLMYVIFNTAQVFAQDDIEAKLQGIAQIQSVFTTTNSVSTIIKQPDNIDNINWQQVFMVKISNQFQFSIASNRDVTIDKISLTLDGTTITNTVTLQLKKPVKPVKSNKLTVNTSQPLEYLFSADNIMQPIGQITKGYTLLGITPSITANDYLGYQTYMYKVLDVTFNWHDATSYNQSTNKFLMVYAK